eukprot:5700595-Pyramimonas_sp.AAC.2
MPSAVWWGSCNLPVGPFPVAECCICTSPPSRGLLGVLTPPWRYPRPSKASKTAEEGHHGRQDGPRMPPRRPKLAARMRPRTTSRQRSRLRTRQKMASRRPPGGPNEADINDCAEAFKTEMLRVLAVSGLREPKT